MKDLREEAGPEAKTVRVGSRTVTLHRDWKPLEIVWRKLEETGRCTVFQCYDWVAPWYENTLKHKVARPLIVTVADQAGIVWILPLCQYRRMGLRFISLADLGVSDYAGPIMARDDRMSPAEQAEVLLAVRKVLPGCDMVHFQKMHAEIEGKANPLLQFGHVVAMKERCYGIEVTRPWGELSKDIMQSRLRSTIRQQRKKIQALGPLSLEHHADGGAITSAMNVLWEMRRGRFNRINRADTPEVWRSFYYDVACNPARKLDVSITILRVGDTPVACSYGLSRGRNYLSVMPTFAVGDWEGYRPGMLMFDAMLEAFGQRTGFDGFFDFTIGDEPYKQRFGAKGRPLMECMEPRSLLGWLAYVYWRFKASRRPKAEAEDDGTE